MKKFYALVSALLIVGTLFAQKIPFQGRLLDAGKPFNGTATINFSIDDPTWSETKSNVSVTDGYYSVVLGSTAPLPYDLFGDSRTVMLNITVNGESLSPVKLHSPLLPYTGSDLISIDSLETVEISIIGNNGDKKGAFGTTSNGYEGVLILKDSLNNTGAFMQSSGVESTGYSRGYLQLNGRTSNGDLRSAVAAGGGVQGRANSFVDLYGERSDGSGTSLLVDVYATDIDLNGPIADGYRRGGMDIKNYFGNFTHNIFSEHSGTSTTSHMNLVASTDSPGSEVYSLHLSSGDATTTGASIGLTDASGTGTISLDGTTGTIDAQQILIGGVPLNGGGSTLNSDSLETKSLEIANPLDNESVILNSSEAAGGFLQLLDPDATGTFNESVILAGHYGTGGAALQMRGMNTTSDGSTLMINNYMTTNDVFSNAMSGGYRRAGIDISDNEGRMLAAIGSNRDESGGDPTGKSGLVMINGPTTRNVYVSGQWWDNSELGIVQVFGQNDNGSGDYSTNVVIQAEDQSGASSGIINMTNTDDGGVTNETVQLGSNNGSGGGWMDLRDSGGSTTIGLDGQNGDITASGDVQGNTLTSSDGMVQTSDRRLKKNISDLENPLKNMLQMRGVSYRWKDESKSQRNQIGVIAQEVEAIYPEFVHTNDKGMKAVNYAQMTAVLIEAIKELNAKVELLEKENGALKAEVAAISQMQKDIEQLKSMLGHAKPASK